MPRRIEDILVVGGGTAGWMTAVYLNRALGVHVRIELVESEAVGTIGVGEATFNTIKSFFDYVGLSEAAWMPACKATYKMAIKFVNWRRERGHFYHPFQRCSDVKGIALPEWWLKLRPSGRAFDYACFNVPELCEAQCSPRHWDGRVFEHVSTYNPYAYHFDAALLARYLQGVGVERGVHHTYGDVVNVDVTPDGAVSGVVLSDGRTLHADFYVDATGFRGLLINQALEVGFRSFSASLFCDSAVAMRIPPERDDQINPYTTATALSAGWVWDIPLANRVGTGYVYSKAFLDEDAAERELRDHLGPRADSSEAAHIKMRVGRCERSWVKNCVAIGLSSGFVEPLESTGIFFIQHALTELVNHFPDRGFDAATIRNYNLVVAECIDGVRDFLILHYWLGDRSDSDFWRAAKSDLDVPDDLLNRLSVWRARLPNPSSVNPTYHGFATYSYYVMLLGLGLEPSRSAPVLDYFDGSEALETFAQIERRGDELLAALPKHAEYIRALNGGSVPI